MGWASTAMNVGGGLLDVYSKNEGAKRQEELHKYNARVAEQDALNAEKEGRQLANRQRGENARLLAKQRALYGGSGVVGGTGTPLAVAAQTAGQLEMAALDNEIAGERAGQQARAEKQLHLLAASDAKRARRMALINSLLSQGQPQLGNLGGMMGGMGGSGGGMQGSSMGGGMGSAAKMGK